MLFVLIYSFSSLDAEKFHMLVRAFSGKNMSYDEIPMLNEIQAREDPIGIIDPMVNYSNRIEEDEIETEDSAGGPEMSARTTTSMRKVKKTSLSMVYTKV